MRVSEFYGLGRTQPALDFVDVDIRNDTRLFIDPRALHRLPSSWADECIALINDYFTAVLAAIRSSRDERALSLLTQLREPNETHLGLSRNQSRGRTLGPHSAKDLWTALRDSDAVASGLLEDIEDALLLVERVGPDIVSDITTNIIREPLIEYTQTMASYYGIPLTSDIPSGRLWDPKKGEWYEEYVELPSTPSGRLLLVPKIIVRARMEYDVDEYFRNYLLEDMRDAELDARTALVELLKNGKRRVTKKALVEKYGSGKSVVIQKTLAHPDALRRFRDDRSRRPRRQPLDHPDMSLAEGTPDADWNQMVAALKSVPSGQAAFSEYEDAVETLISALFYPSLVTPRKQVKLHEGRKRVDIVYTNAGVGGFFGWVSANYPAGHVFVECKNYDGDPANPELDQLSGRFSPSRGQVGILACRALDDKKRFLKRCRDTAQDCRGFIIPLDDDDLAVLAKERRESVSPYHSLLFERFRGLIE